MAVWFLAQTNKSKLKLVIPVFRTLYPNCRNEGVTILNYNSKYFDVHYNSYIINVQELNKVGWKEPLTGKGEILSPIGRESDLLSLILVRMIIRSDETANVRVYNADLPNRQITPKRRVYGTSKNTVYETS